MIKPKIVIIDGEQGRWLPEELARALYDASDLNMFNVTGPEYRIACVAKSSLHGEQFLSGGVFENLEVVVVG